VIQQDIACENAAVLSHPVEIHQILTNLCTNAGHAMEERGGVLEVSLANATFHSDWVPPFSDIQPGEYVVLKVSDTGHGMNKETMERIFDPYFTTKEVGKGSGLGLAVVHGIVKRLGGAVNVYSEVGKGTTFQVYLPRHESVAGTAVEGKKPIPGGVERILFVDDEAALVDIWQNVLKKLGYSVVVLTSGPEALSLFRAQPGDFDLVITDFTMPLISGVELAREIVSIRSDIPVILCTGLSSRIAAGRSPDPAIRALLAKPLNVRTAAEMIRNVLDNRTT
jgi:CheY-like chemotaxis protein